MVTPFPVPLKVYDETITTLEKSVKRAKIGHYDKQKALNSLHKMTLEIETKFKLDSENQERNFDKIVAKERRESYKFNGRTVNGWASAPITKSGQFQLF